MRTASLLALLASARGIWGICTQNQCADAITSVGVINVGLQSRSIDCAKFLETTVTPNASFALITTSANMEDYPYIPSQTTAPAAQGTIPAYASFCTDDGAYSSACACASITQSTVVAPTPTTYLYDQLPLCPNPKTCAQGYSDAACAGGAGVCVPSGSDDGSGFCISAGVCGQTCVHNLDCPTGICIVDTCCGSTCSNPSVQFVTNWPPTPNKLVKKGLASFGDIVGKLNGAKGKLLGSSKNKILGDFTPQNPQPANLLGGWP